MDIPVEALVDTGLGQTSSSDSIKKKDKALVAMM